MSLFSTPLSAALAGTGLACFCIGASRVPDSGLRAIGAAFVAASFALTANTNPSGGRPGASPSNVKRVVSAATRTPPNSNNAHHRNIGNLQITRVEPVERLGDARTVTRSRRQAR